ncbi:alanine--tRNA ligase [Cohnella sp. JJ-181]|uniref:alanine--tRNA ligase n=1 Tax=Cohnella rhizoplanae TaxID=2974897 RepID=UPI0022FF784B|nr:alanine--tRNA ligase [Cohnella sp. JJ-181]CAI6015156.1 Alanine--tRNA ligase [Cohnella sp. JJ-181]
MQPLKAAEIRDRWLRFFASKGHRVEPSASLVPHNDPSLLWINAGMAPLKAYFDGREKPENPRIANSQKCIRTNDIENVGKTRRHHTFFEMLGNFSIGDYFKEEAITWAWEFLTGPEWIGFAPERLSVTVHPDDEEAFKFWNEKIGIPAERIVKLTDNFWDIGEGPCGPCTEIFYDRGDAYGDLSDPECFPGGENERFLEVWNLVFSQFNHNKDGSYTPLPNKNIDTGAGLERFASIVQDVDSNFDTDLFQPIIARAGEIAGVAYKVIPEHDVALKVIADHIRTVAFAVGDGVMPSNEGRGYIIRRLLRRAVRYGKVIGVDRPFLWELVTTVGGIMGGYYPAVVEKAEFIERVIRTEEERFHETLSDGLSLLADLCAKAASAGERTVSGADAFKLYDTYGFPFDLTEDYAAEQGMTVDREGFDAAMDEQRQRARAARQETESMKVQGGPLADYTAKSEFDGYGALTLGATVAAIVSGDRFVDAAGADETVSVILDRTPFYAESGGQVSDTGMLVGEGGLVASVGGMSKAPHGQPLHQVTVTSGTLKVGDKVTASVDAVDRADIVRNHTATHLLHKALKQVLGEHVNQAGSLVEPGRLRFDFSHFGAITADELADVERRVNEQIWLGTDVDISLKPIDEAKTLGAMALFGEKYGDIVRVVRVGDYSLELCGGCHVSNTAQIGLFRLVGESGIGSGVRRIEAVTGRHAYAYMDEQIGLLKSAAGLLKTGVAEVPRRIESLQGELRQSQREVESLQSRLGRLEAADLLGGAKEVGGLTLLAAQVNAGGMDALRGVADELKAKLPEAVLVLGAVHDDKVSLVVSVSPSLVKRGLHAGKLIKELAAICGGGGGGKPELAQAGGKDPSKLGEALSAAEGLVAAAGAGA